MDASKHPAPWAWKTEQLNADKEPVLLDRDGGVVCHFGYSTQYYPSEGAAPDTIGDQALIAAAPEMEKLIRRFLKGDCRSEEAAAVLARIDKARQADRS